MSVEDNIRNAIVKFYKELSPTSGVFWKASELWKESVFNRTIVTSSETDLSDNQRIAEEIELNHWQMAIDLKGRVLAGIEKQFRNLQPDDVSDSVDKAWDDFLRKFDPKKNRHPRDPEYSALRYLAYKKACTKFRRNQKWLNLEIEVNSSGLLRKGTTIVGSGPTGSESIEESRLGPRSSIALVDGERHSLLGFDELIRHKAMSGNLLIPPNAGDLPESTPDLDQSDRPVERINQFQFRKPVRLSAEAFNERHERFFGEHDTPSLDPKAESDFYFARWTILRDPLRRRFMELAISELRKSLEKKTRQLTELSEAGLDTTKLAKTPVLAAVVVSADRRHVYWCHKGEFEEMIDDGSRDVTWDHHCEYMLFERVVGDDEKHLFVGGDLYVTLEPCSKRGATGRESDRHAKIPCAVRCLEMGIKRVYVASIDFHPKVDEDGIEILTNGTYCFDLHNGLVTGKPAELEGIQFLEKHFIEKKYPITFESEKRREYWIGNSVELDWFDADLSKEAYELNWMFQQPLNSEAFEAE